MTTADVEFKPADLVTKIEISKALNVSQRTIDSWVKSGRIPSVRVTPRFIRYHVPSVMAALMRKTKEAA